MIVLFTNDKYVKYVYLGGGFKHFLFSPLFGEDSHFDDHIFQMGWFNHQPDIFTFLIIPLHPTCRKTHVFKFLEIPKVMTGLTELNAIQDT